MSKLVAYTTLLLVVLLEPWGEVDAQRVQLSFRNFTTADGLPSSETHFVMEDSQGYLWVGTDNGLARFDSYEFAVYDADDGLEDGVVFMMQETSDGVIWVSTLSGRIFYFENDRFHPYQFNDVILEIKQSSELMYLLDVLPNGDIVVRINYEGIIKIDTVGDITWLTEEDGKHFYLYQTGDPGSVFARQTRYHFGERYSRGNWNGGEVLVGVGGEWKPFDDAVNLDISLRAGRPSVLDMLTEGNGFMLVSYDRIVHLFPDGRKFTFPHKSRVSTHLLYSGEDEYFITTIGGSGLKRLRMDYEQETVQADTFLEGRSLSMAAYDSKGGLWITSLDAGVFYCPYPKQELLVAKTEGLSPRPTSICMLGKDRLVGTFADASIYYFDGVSSTQQEVPFTGKGGGYQASDIYYDSTTQSLLGLNYRFEMQTDDQEIKFKQLKYNFPYSSAPFSAKEITKVQGDIYWTGTQNYGTINPETGEVDLKIKSNYRTREYTHGLESFHIFPGGRKFIGSWYGLKEVMPDGSLRAENLGIPELSGRIERIVGWGDNRVAIGTRSSGVVVWTPEEHFVLGFKDSLASDIIRNLHVTDDGTLWVATLKGLSKVEAQEGGRPKVRTFNLGNGLLDNEVHDMDSYKNDLWLVSTAGIYQFQEPPFDSISAPPEMKSVLVNKDTFFIQEDLDLLPRQNFLTFFYASINFNLGKKIRYRYRINPDQAWQISRERTANYPNLPAGDYRFEVQSENQDGVWSKSSFRSVHIAQFWYRTWKAAVLAGILVFGGLFLFFIIREQRQRREQDLLLEISRLEHSALHAQMNPHFVFNSLNSIQNFILHNDTVQAARYLSRFANLIRQTLRSSVRGVHSLAEEYEMLNRYLELEKLRFKDLFDYVVEVDDELPRDEILVPPLLVQPFVENTVLHAFTDRTEGGLLQVRFSGSRDLVKITIIDNGVGIDPDAPAKEDSMGMGITRRRLELLKGRKHPGLTLDVQPIKDAKGLLAGTCVTLHIRPVSSIPKPLKV